MRKFAQWICILLVFVLVFSTTVCAADVSNGRASNYFAVTSVNLRKVSGSLEAWFDVTAVGTMEQLGARTVVIQRSSDGNSWSSVKTFTKESYPEMIREDFAAHTCCLTYTPTAGYYYRACVTFYAKKGNGTGELIQYSSSIKL